MVQSGDSKWPFPPIVGGHLDIEKGHLTIPKRSQRIASQVVFGQKPDPHVTKEQT